MFNLSKTFGLIAPVLLMAATTTLVVVAPPTPKAEACRDCPFPMFLREGRWRMPSGNSDITISEVNLGSGRILSVVRLFDSNSGELLALGSVTHTKGRRRLKVDLVDGLGGTMTAEVYFPAIRDRSKLRVKLSCQSCNLHADYLN